MLRPLRFIEKYNLNRPREKKIKIQNNSNKFQYFARDELIIKDLAMT